MFSHYTNSRASRKTPQWCIERGVDSVKSGERSGSLRIVASNHERNNAENLRSLRTRFWSAPSGVHLFKLQEAAV